MGDGLWGDEVDINPSPHLPLFLMAIRIYLPDQSEKKFDNPPSVLEVAQSIGPRLAKDTLGGLINGAKEIVDLRTKLNDGDRIEIITMKSPRANEVIRHSAAHVMAQAVQELWPEVKVTIGPVIDSGFYYDFDSPRAFLPEDLEKIEKKMKEIASRDLEIRKEDWPIAEAIETFSKMSERFKVELIQDLAARGEKVVGIYHQGNWFDLCRGPHVQRTSQIPAVKVLSLAGAYWRGDETKAQLQRIYATAFTTQKELDEHLLRLEEAKKRDHRKLGKDLGLFHFHALAPGSPFFTGKGSVIYLELENYIRELYRETGYQEVITPQVFDTNLYQTSGHMANYNDNMYFMRVDERDFSLKPMNCPGHCILYQMGQYSYRDLPLRIADFGRLHRYERSGVMHGLSRVRTFCQDDAHIFCTLEQMQSEIRSFMMMLKRVYDTLGMTRSKIFLATRPEKRMGTEESWDHAEGALAKALESLNLPFEISPGEGAFYGPKLEVHFMDALDRSWQLGTVQVDPNLPERFELRYTGEDNKDHRPVMLHRAILGSLERFIGVYLEHTAGQLPLWLTPVQMKILNVTDRQKEYCEKILKQLRASGFRVEWDNRNEKLGFKIREAQMEKVGYMVVVGDKEMENNQVTLRLRNGHQEQGLAFEEFLLKATQERLERSLVSPWRGPGVSAESAARA